MALEDSMLTIIPLMSRGGFRGGGGERTRCAPPLKLEKIWFFGVKSWFFTRNTPKIFAPPSVRCHFFKYTPPPNLKSWIRPWWGIWFDILKYNDNHFFNFKKHRVSFFYGFLSALFKLIYWKPILFKFGQDFNLTGFSASQENINKNIPGPIISRRIFSYWRCAKPVGRLPTNREILGPCGSCFCCK